MPLSAHSIERLVDLVEIKLSCMQVLDRDDAREQAGLERCLRELATLRSAADAGDGRRGALQAA